MTFMENTATEEGDDFGFSAMEREFETLYQVSQVLILSLDFNETLFMGQGLDLELFGIVLSKTELFIEFPFPKDLHLLLLLFQML